MTDSSSLLLCSSSARKILHLSLPKAACTRKWIGVSFSSPHSRHKVSFFIPIKLKCLLSLHWPVRTTTIWFRDLWLRLHHPKFIRSIKKVMGLSRSCIIFDNMYFQDLTVHSSHWGWYIRLNCGSFTKPSGFSPLKSLSASLSHSYSGVIFSFSWQNLKLVFY